ncbi:hypothetical protein AGMMS49960_22220 [Betaproteobacteria bacterium]|nr:hypothetical protein AGMMS49960_22220 [Betaproteobacteria bacterium]
MNEKPPMFPVWLSPTQVRIIPIAEKYIEFSNKLFNKIYKNNIRVDIDDREDRIGKKIRNASKEWIPYTIVVGDKEVETNEFNVSIRSTGKKKNMAVDELIKEVKSQSKDLPFRKLTLPKILSDRINFQ